MTPDQRRNRYSPRIASYSIPQWDELKWREKTKKKAVRPKPYEIQSAADKCAELARKDGWLDVDVIAITKVDVPAAIF